ncbi:sulfite exporter TauE/SafE/copper chaperone CopZ [Anaerosolibacter carboniphilus]|uniref:Sulfite exporter TauE/SafE/copper chaperone CopZ n=1 Tax=Anaerosolibacter carboniphilus TaxID=1417629 RepID=A0A841KTM1_9FIRM|nr:sulfite exporter TauE/SafE family protein [Anaerosolibacter carboniphilus]MBB6216771.1 sulfite exporter TauE/SafE/copper chaperone CopZ [Anaerosolibacter carboniphilus]
MKKITLFIDGMTCGNCEARIEKALQKLNGVHHVKASFHQSRVEIHYDEDLVDEKLFQSNIEALGYGVMKEGKHGFKKVMPLLLLLFAGFYLIQNTIGFNFIPEVSEGMGYGLIFMVGLLTSIHCVAMCGGIALSQSVGETNGGRRFTPSLLYNAGRIVSYTVIGGIVGGVGAVVTPSGQFKGIVAIGAGVFMFLLGLKMLNILHFPNWLGLRMPSIAFGKIGGSTPFRPFFVGLMNGLMPCGPLQTMQLYALGTGSVAKGALSMFFFSAGTVPLLFIFGAITSAISNKSSRTMMKASAVLVMVLGIVMLNRGMALSGMALDLGLMKGTVTEVPEIKMEDGKQVINMTVTANGYTPDNSVVQVGVPVKIKFDVQSINGCNNPIVIPEYNVEVNLMEENPEIEFIPTKEGKIRISCWMGMITSQLTAVNDPSQPVEVAKDNSTNGGLFGGGCCASVQGENKAAVALIADGQQTIEMNVGNDGYSPNIFVVQKDMPVTWIMNGIEINSCNYILTIPDAGFQKEVKEGKNEIRFTPNQEGELVFTCGMNMLSGKIVIVDDVNNVDLEALENSDIPLPASSGGSCH